MTRAIFGEPVFDHVAFGVGDRSASKAFIVKAREPPGLTVVPEGRLGIELGTDGKSSLCIGPTEEKPAHLHLAFTAGSRRHFEAFHRAAPAAGGRDNGARGLPAAVLRSGLRLRRPRRLCRTRHTMHVAGEPANIAASPDPYPRGRPPAAARTPR